MNWSDLQKKDYLQLVLKGHAENWMITIQIKGEWESKSFSDIKALMLDTFRPKNYQYHAMNSLVTFFQQVNETVDAYYLRLLRSAHEANLKECDIIKNLFIRGLHPYLKEKLEIRASKSLDALVMDARNLEYVKRISSVSTAQQTAESTSNVFMLNTTDNQYRDIADISSNMNLLSLEQKLDNIMNILSENSSSPNLAIDLLQPQNLSQRSSINQVKCTNCGRMGHSIEKCYSKTKLSLNKVNSSTFRPTCGRCGKSGHISDKCYSTIPIPPEFQRRRNRDNYNKSDTNHQILSQLGEDSHQVTSPQKEQKN